MVGISIATESGKGYYIPIGHQDPTAGAPQLALGSVLEALTEAFTDPKIPKVGHNLKYDYLLLARAGLRTVPLSFDTMIAEWLCDPASRNLGLKNLAWVRLGIEMTEITELIGSGRSQKSMSEVPIRDVAPYAVADAEVCLRLMPELEQELREKDQLTLFTDLEMPLVQILAEMELNGISLDSAYLKALAEEMEENPPHIS